MAELVLVRGLPGSGKSTYIKNEYPSHVHLEADMYFMDSGEYKFDPAKLGSAHMWCLRNARDYLTRGMNVAVSNTFTTPKELHSYAQVAKELNVPVTIIAMKTAYGNIHNVPQSKLEEMANRWKENDGIAHQFEGLQVTYREVI